MVCRPSIAVRYLVTFDDLKCQASQCDYAIRGNDKLATHRYCFRAANGQRLRKGYGAEPACLGLILGSGDDGYPLTGMVKFRRRGHGFDERCISDAGLRLRLLGKCHKGDCGENVFHADPPGQKMEA
jgi:hypothetical protein